MAVISLPLSFSNSFWSQDYRRGLEVLFKKLEQGVAENDEIIAFIQARAEAESNIAAALSRTTDVNPPGTAFSADDGATLLMAFRGLQSETVKQGEAHRVIAHELRTLVVDPFEQWAVGHRERLAKSRATIIDGYLRSYETFQNEVSQLKNLYLLKVRKADEAEDDAKFAPGNDIGDRYTTSARLSAHETPQRSLTLSGRIAQKLKDIQRNTTTSSTSTASSEESYDQPENEPLKVDKGKGKAVEDPELIPASQSPLTLSPEPPTKLEIPDSNTASHNILPIVVADLSFTPSALSALLTRAASQLNLRPVRFPLLGEYKDCFTGEEFVVWLAENMNGLGGSIGRAEDVAQDLTEHHGLLRRIGEFGNQFESSNDAFYQFRPRAFDLVSKPQDSQSLTSAMSPTKLTPIADNLVKRSNNFFSVVSKALNTNGQNEPPHIRARAEAVATSREYRIAVRKLDRHRLGLEERIEEALKVLQKWEMDRLRAVKTVLLQYHGTLSNLTKPLDASFERSNTLISAYLPETDLTALIERYRTGPFRPNPHVYEGVSHVEADVIFGIDLRKWAESSWSATPNQEEKEDVPPVLTALLDGLTTAYTKMPDDQERRKTWIYDVPLPAVHHLRESLNAILPDQPIPADLMAKYDGPVVASTLKLWVLELDPPIALWEGWDEIRRLYPSVGSSVQSGEKDQTAEQEHLERLQSALIRLPRVNLYVLDAIISHLKNLIDSTQVEEPDETYITKLALSLGRAILRPKVETEMTIQDRHPAMLFIDLIKYYSEILPPTIARKTRELERKVPTRKRTAPVDMRMSRSRLSVDLDAQNWLAAQRSKSPTPTPVPATLLAQKSPPPSGLPSSGAKSPSAPSTEYTTASSASAPHTPVETAGSQTPVSTHQPSTPPTEAPASVVQSPPLPPASELDIPPIPTFKEPPPEFDAAPVPAPEQPSPEIDLPPRPPAFKEPDLSDITPSPPPPSVEPAAPATSPLPSPPAVPMPARNLSPPPASPSSPRVRVRAAGFGGSMATGSRSPSPPVVSGNEDAPVGTGRVTLSRNTSADTPRKRLSRVPRPLRTGGGGSVSNIVQSLNKNQAAQHSPPPYSAAQTPRRHIGLASSRGSLSRRTMDSDAEDNITQ